MPRLKASARSLPGPLVTTSGQVISGAGSPGQQVWMGRRPRSIVSPRSTTSWQGARATVFGFIASAALSRGTMSTASRQPPGGSGCLKKASISPSCRSSPGSRFMPQATRSTVPNRLASSGSALPSTCSNRTAGPRSARRRVWISVISRTGETWRPHANQPAGTLETLDELPQTGVGHGGSGSARRPPLDAIMPGRAARDKVPPTDPGHGR